MCVLCQRSPCVVSGTAGGATATATTGTATAVVLSSEPATVPTRAKWGALDSGYAWTGGAVSFGFASGAADYYGYPDPGYTAPYSGYNEPSQFIGLSAAGKGIVRAAFSSWGGAVTLTITEAASGVHPDLNVGGSAIPDTAWAYYPGTNDSSGDVWFGLDQSFFARLVGSSGPYLGSYEYATALHEIGHALGQKHPHQGTVKLAAAYDGLEYSVMSYRSYLGGPTSYYTVETWGFPQSLMMLDIAAIQDLYGADFTTQSGATVYRFDPLTGAMTVNGASAGVPGANRVFRTIWDGGGSDTIDLSAYASNLDIDLNPGKGIDLDVGGTLQRAQLAAGVYAAHHIYMSLLYNGDTRSLIENATGGTGDDILRGNLAANLLKGGAGADTLTGGPGADTLTLGTGADTVTDTAAGLNGDTITDFSLQDRLVVRGASLSSAHVAYNAKTGQLRIDTNRDGTPEAVIAIGTKLAGSSLQVSAAGGSSVITFSGTANSPSSGAATGSGTTPTPTATTVTLGDGADTYVGPAGRAVIVYGLAGTDNITGSSGNDMLYGGDHRDVLSGGAGNDILIGGGAKDTLTGGAGRDRFVVTINDKPATSIGQDVVTDFTPGTDTIDLQGFTARSFADLDIRSVASGTMIVIDRSFYLSLNGISPSALSARDVVFAAKVSAGNAPAGMAETFVFHETAGAAPVTDIVQDFTPGLDRIRLLGFDHLAGFADLDLTQSGADVRVALSPTQTLVLPDTGLSDLTTDSFAFA